MIILGIDPSLNSLGYCVLLSDKSVVRVVEVGNIKSKISDSYMDKLKTIHAKFCEINSLHKPDILAIEETFVNTNAQSSLKLGVVRGVCLSPFLNRDCKIVEYAPRVVKKRLTGNGSADKTQVMYMVKAIIPSIELSNNDESDAVAIAISCYLEFCG
jgi:crossover junction endodeoxyribonuclease RuvC